MMRAQHARVPSRFLFFSEQSVKAAPNVWASRHSAGLPPSLPAASS